MDIILKEYNLAIKENNNMIESAMSMLDVNAYQLYLLECEGYTLTETEANDLFLEEVAKFTDKIKLFFMNSIMKMKELFMKSCEKFAIWITDKCIESTLSLCKKRLSHDPNATIELKKTKMEALDQKKYIKSFSEFLNYSIKLCTDINNREYKNIDEYIKISNTAIECIDKKRDHIKSTDEYMGTISVIDWINSDQIDSWKLYMKHVLNEAEKTLNSIKDYACSEDDMTKIKDYYKISSYILSTFDIVLSNVMTDVNKNCREAMSVTKKAISKKQ